MTKEWEQKINMEFRGFSKLTLPERLQRLLDLGFIEAPDREYLQSGGLRDPQLAENFIENVLGWMQVPLGVATNFVIDDKSYVIPMAVEETSIVAAASKTARWVAENGSIRTETIGREIIGQVQFPKITNFSKMQLVLQEYKAHWIRQINEDVVPSMVRRGGGVRDLVLRLVPRQPDEVSAELSALQVENPSLGDMAVLHVLMDPVDAMGANLINQVCEFLKLPLAEKMQEDVGLCILSNLVDTRRTRAVVEMPKVEDALAARIEEASVFAESDPYRAATSNKGVLNGIDPILLATGNDWRAVEAGVHAFAARSGKYRSITRWRRRKGGGLVGELEAPLVVGTVGGVTHLHPTASMSLRILHVKSALELSRVCAAVGLVQNLGALRALTTVGIIEGHMKLHLKNLSLSAGAQEQEIPLLVARLEEVLSRQKRVSLSHAAEALRVLRTAQDEAKEMVSRSSATKKATSESAK